MSKDFYIPKGTHGQLLRPYQGAWSITLYQTKLPQVMSTEKVIFTPADVELGKVLGSTFLHYAKLGYMGIQLQDRSVFLVKEGDTTFEVPEDFDELYWEAEDEMDQEAAAAAWSPFR